MHLLVLPPLLFLLHFLYAPGDIKFLMGFSLWNSFATSIWIMLFTLVIELFLIFFRWVKKSSELPMAPIFLISYFFILLMYQIFPITSLIYS